MKVEGHYVKLNVEKYGGMLCAPWFDRPLSIAGRLVVRTADGLQTKLVNVDRDLVMIPNLAIHMNRQVNDGYAYNAQSDMLPLYGGEAAAGTLMKTIAQSAGVAEEDILMMVEAGAQMISEQEMLDAIRCRNGNLGIVCGRIPEGKEEL